MDTDSKKSTDSINSKENQPTKKKELCKTCEGTGFTKSEPIYVNNIKYVPCKPCGKIRNHYDICDTCHGSGREE